MEEPKTVVSSIRIQHEAIEPWRGHRDELATALGWLKELPLTNLILFASLIGSVLLGLYCISIRYFPFDDLGGLAALVLIFFGPCLLLLSFAVFILVLPLLAMAIVQWAWPKFKVDTLDVVVPPFVMLAVFFWGTSLDEPLSLRVSLGALLLTLAVPFLEYQLVSRPKPWMRAGYHLAVGILSLIMLILVFQIIDRHLGENTDLSFPRNFVFQR